MYMVNVCGYGRCLVIAAARPFWFPWQVYADSEGDIVVVVEQELQDGRLILS